METRTVIFDFYGTLAGPAAPARSILDLMLALGVNIPDGAAERWDIDHLDGLLHEEASASERAYEEWVDRRWHGMLDDCSVSADRRDGIIGAIRAQIASFRVRAFPESAVVLQELRRRGLRLAICSNWHWDLDTYIEQAGLTGLVDLAITSAQIGARKDHPVIYDRTLAALQAEPETTVFVGDSWAPDVLGPIRAGMRAAHVVRDGRPAPELPVGAVRIADLSELYPHL